MKILPMIADQGEGDRTKCGGGAFGAAHPSTSLWLVPLPIACGDRED